MEELDSSALQKLEEERLRLEEKILEERKRLEEGRQARLEEKLKKVSAEEMEKQMTVKEVVEYLGLDEESINRFVATNQIPFIETPEGVRFEKGSMDIFRYFLDTQNAFMGFAAPGSMGFGGGGPGSA